MEDRLVAVKLDTLGDQLSTNALVETLADRVKEVDVSALCYTFAKVDAETLLYARRLPVVEKEKVANTPTKVECTAVLDTLAATETEVKVHIQSEVKGKETFYALSDTVAKNEVKSRGDTASGRRKGA